MGFTSNSLKRNHSGIFYPFYKLAFICFLACISLLACHSGPNAKDKKNNGTEGLIQLPAPTPISAAEKARYHDACASWYDSMLKPGIFNGGMLVAKGGNILFERYQGMVNLKSGDSINAQTAFHIASVSKTFTSAAILQLKEEGKLQLLDPVEKYFPLFDYPGISIQTLLTHRSGLPNYTYFLEDLKWDQRQKATNNDVLQALINHKSDIKDIGAANKNFSYSNTNFALLALIIEKVSGQSYPDFLQEHFFKPLQMNHSFVYTLADSATVHPNFDRSGRAIPNNYLDYVYGDKNIYSTPEDLLKWDRALTAHLVLSKPTMDTAYMPYSNERPGVKNYGLGWRMNHYPNDKKVVFHNGWWHGNNAAFIRLFDEDATIIVLGNRDNHNIYKAYQLVNLFGNYFQTEEPIE